MNKIEQFESLWSNYIAKLARLDELKQNGRYGYQLRMPRKSIVIAANKLREWCKANNETVPPCVCEGNS